MVGGSIRPPGRQRRRLLPALRQAVQQACDDLAGEQVDTLYDEDRYSNGLQFDVPLHFEAEAYVDVVYSDLDSLTWVARDGIDDGMALAQVTVDAEVTFEGAIHKADFAADDTGLEVYDSDWNRHYLRAGATHMVRLTFDASIDTHTGQIELVFENGLSLTDSSDPSPDSN